MLLRGITYFAMVFGVGFVLGVVRVLWIEPQLGTRGAELAEAPLMLLAILLSARLIVRRFPAPQPISYLASGGLALLLLLSLEFTVVLALRGITLGEYLQERDPLAGGVYLLLLVLFAAMPWLLGRRRNTR